MKAEVISVGTELLLGQIVNTDAQIISDILAPLGIDMYYHTTVGDNENRLGEVFECALNRSDLVFTTGGLGPTMDDVTKETVAKKLSLKLKLNQKELENIEKIFERSGRSMPPGNVKQALFPQESQVIPNKNGTAPGAIVEKEGKVVVILPGPPRELQPMMIETIVPFLQEKTAGRKSVIKSRVLKLCGIGESAAEEAIKDLILDQTNPTIAPLAGSEVTFRITAKASSEQSAQRLIKTLEDKVRERLFDHVYGCDEDTLESVIGAYLKKRKMSLVTAESCTGGIIASRITSIPGSSSYFDRGYVCYSNQSKKELLGVSEEILSEHGAVSKETALAMAQGARESNGAQIALSVTGIAGPSGGTEDKPVGLIWFGLSTPDNEETISRIYGGNRMRIRSRAAQFALQMLWDYLRRKDAL